MAIARLPANPSAAGQLVMQAFRWKVNQHLTVTQDGGYTDYLEHDLGHLATFNVGANVPVAKWFSVTVGYRYKQEDNGYVRALHVSPSDRSFTTGFRFSK